MIYVTGDIHCPHDIGKLATRQFPAQKTLTKQDHVIICGDFGCGWAGDRQDAYWLDWLQDKPFTTLFVDGNHENFDLLSRYPEERWQGGRVHRLRPSVIHLMRGQVFDIAGMRCFTLGGASSHDRSGRVEGRSWWPEELPSDADFQEALANLDAAGWRVDTVLTHCASERAQVAIAPWFERDRLTNFLQYLEERLHFDHWYFGHYHVDKVIDERHRALYGDILCIQP